MSPEFDLFVAFWHTVGVNSSMTWRILNNKILILYYFNDKNVNLENMLTLLNCFACEYMLERNGWKLPFNMQKSNSESWNYDYIKRVEFVVKNDFFR